MLLELIATKEGRVVVKSFGEASPLYPYSNETPLSVYELLSFYYSSYLVGKSINIQDRYSAKHDIDRIIEQVERYLSKERLNFTQTAIDYALHLSAGFPSDKVREALELSSISRRK